MKAFDVFLPVTDPRLRHFHPEMDDTGKLVEVYGMTHIDTVFFNTNEHPEDVRRSLVNHDGYPESIRIRTHRWHVPGAYNYND